MLLSLSINFYGGGIKMIGQRFGKLLVLEQVGKNKRGILFKCQCDCGNRAVYPGKDLRSENNKSCGCLRHGMSGTRIHEAWTNMKRRCNDPNNKSYPNYGGRGITYDESWEEFRGFYEDMKEGYDDRLTLDRIDVNGPYSKENCRWVDMEEQANNKTSNRMLTYQGETLTMSQMARKHGLPVDLLKGRLYKGWTVKDAIERKTERETLAFNGETKTVTEWAEENGMTYHQLKKRLMRGWSVERAITQPLRRRSKSQ